MSIPGAAQLDASKDAAKQLAQLKGIAGEQRDLLKQVLEELRAIRQLLELPDKRVD